MTRGEFATKFLHELGTEVTLHKRRAMQCWIQSEGSAAKNNPLDCTVKMPGSTDFNWNNGFPVQNYGDGTTGMKATVKTIRGSGHNYGPIIRAFESNATADDIVDAIAASSWGTSKQLMHEVLSELRPGKTYLTKLERKSIAT